MVSSLVLLPYQGEYTIFYRNVHLEKKSTQSEIFWPLYCDDTIFKVLSNMLSFLSFQYLTVVSISVSFICFFLLLFFTFLFYLFIFWFFF